jgi:hypothetical protein
MINNYINMIVEVILIQKYTLLIGASIYSIVTILLTLLISSGIGSRFSTRVGDKLAFGAIIFLLLFVFISDATMRGAIKEQPCAETASD